jgi:hypothetical protein
MSSSIKEEYITPDKPAIKSTTIRSVLIAAGAVILEHVVTASPAIALLILSITPEWLKGFLTIELIQGTIETILYAIAGAAGITIVTERVKKGDISGVLKVKE